MRAVFKNVSISAQLRTGAAGGTGAWAGAPATTGAQAYAEGGQNAEPPTPSNTMHAHQRSCSAATISLPRTAEGIDAQGLAKRSSANVSTSPPPCMRSRIWRAQRSRARDARGGDHAGAQEKEVESGHQIRETKMPSRTSVPSRRSFLSAAGAASAFLWIPKPVQGYTAAEMRGMTVEGVVKPGVSKWELDTPALCVDLDKMEKNVETMQAALKRVRPAEPAAREDAQVRRDREGPALDRLDRHLLRQAQRSGSA